MKGCKNMNWWWRGWRRVLVGLMLVDLVLVACSTVTEGSRVMAPQPEPTVVVGLGEGNAMPSDESVRELTINVTLTDDGFQPPAIFIPAGRRVKLVVRSRGTTELHYRVLGLVPRDLLWISEPKGGREEGVSEEEHEHHHAAGFVRWRSKSPAGIRPIGDEVHAYAEAGGVDVVSFTPTNTGTFLVQCPLHPQIAGKATVYEVPRP